MDAVTELNGVPTWYAAHDKGDSLVYLHGGFSEASELDVAELAGVRARTLVVSGDDDVVTLEHTLALYRGLPDAELAVVPGASHVLVTEKPELVTTLVLDFLTTEPVDTVIPIHRRR